MTKYVKCRIIEPDNFERPSQPQAARVYLDGVSESGPINIKKHFIGKYQTRKAWYLPSPKRLDQYV